MKALLLALLAALCLPAPAGASAIAAYWSPSDLQRLVSQRDELGVVMPEAQGLGFPLLLVFAADGSLVWQGNPSELPALSLRAAKVSVLEEDLARALGQMDEITRQVVAEGTALPSESIVVGRPTAILVVLSANKGLCPPCDSALSILEQLPADWNRITAALTI